METSDPRERFYEACYALYTLRFMDGLERGKVKDYDLVLDTMRETAELRYLELKYWETRQEG